MIVAFIKNQFSGEGSSFLDFSRGDLILLDEENTGETVLNSGWCAGTNERTEERGDFPAEAVYVLPCLNKPPDDILVRIIFNMKSPFFTDLKFTSFRIKGHS